MRKSYRSLYTAEDDPKSGASLTFALNLNLNSAFLK